MNDKDQPSERQHVPIKPENSSRLSTAVTIGGVLGVLSSLVGALFTNDLRPERPAAENAAPFAITARRLDDQQRQINRLQQQVQDAIQAQARSGTAGQPPLSLILLQNRIAAVEAEESRINAVVLATPEKALTLPMMQRDIADLKSNEALVADQLRREIDRIYDLNKWIIGGLAAGVLSLVIGQFIRRKEKEE